MALASLHLHPHRSAFPSISTRVYATTLIQSQCKANTNRMISTCGNREKTSPNTKRGCLLSNLVCELSRRIDIVHGVHIRVQVFVKTCRL